MGEQSDSEDDEASDDEEENPGGGKGPKDSKTENVPSTPDSSQEVTPPVGELESEEASSGAESDDDFNSGNESDEPDPAPDDSEDGAD